MTWGPGDREPELRAAGRGWLQGPDSPRTFAAGRGPGIGRGCWRRVTSWAAACLCCLRNVAAGCLSVPPRLSAAGAPPPRQPHVSWQGLPPSPVLGPAAPRGTPDPVVPTPWAAPCQPPGSLPATGAEQEPPALRREHRGSRRCLCCPASRGMLEGSSAGSCGWGSYSVTRPMSGTREEKLGEGGQETHGDPAGIAWLHVGCGTAARASPVAPCPGTITAAHARAQGRGPGGADPTHGAVVARLGSAQLSTFPPTPPSCITTT